MNETMFYVQNIYDDYVPAKYLTINGQNVFDPNDGLIVKSSQDSTLVPIKLYSDTNGTLLIPQNTNGWLIVPADFELSNTVTFAQQLDSVGLQADPIPEGSLSEKYVNDLSILENPYVGINTLLSDLINNFVPGGNQDPQRTYETILGINNEGVGPVVKAFTSAASWNLGLTAYLAGIPLWAVELGGGLLNVLTNPSGNQNGIFFNSTANISSIVGGYNDGQLVGKPGILPDNPFSEENGVYTITTGVNVVQISQQGNSLVINYNNNVLNPLVPLTVVLNKNGTESVTNHVINGLESYVTNYYNIAGVIVQASYNFTNSAITSISAKTGTLLNQTYNSVSNALSGSLTVASNGIELGLASLDVASGIGTLTLTDNEQISLASLPQQTALTPVSGSNQSTLYILSQYLSDLGSSTSTAQLISDNFAYLNPTGTAYTENGTVSLNPGSQSVTVTFGVGSTPGAVVTGETSANVTVNGTLTSLPAINLLVATGDISQDSISNVQTLDTYGTLSLTGAQFNAFTAIEGSGNITVTQGGEGTVESLANASDTATIGTFAATGWGGTTLIGNNDAGQTLKASLFGNDTLRAGSGAGDALIAGDGVDTLVGGNGGDSFTADALAAGSTLTGNGTGNVESWLAAMFLNTMQTVSAF